MIDCDVSHLIDGPNIDRPFNAMTLTKDLHSYFGAFKLYFEAILGRSTPTAPTPFSLPSSSTKSNSP